MTAVRQAEKAVRRGGDDDSGRDRDRPAQRAERDLPQVEVPDFRIVGGHPRLFVRDRWPEPVDHVARDWQAILVKRADDALGDKPIDYSSNKLLGRSREALKRISLLGAVYRFTHDRRYADAGRREMLNVCRFPDWQPDDFLATAEMMNAVAIGYDWTYDALSAADRREIADAIMTHGLRPALDAYASHGGWTTARHNWNLVCNGGVIVAGLAVADEQSVIAKRALANALASIRYGLSAYDEHGGEPEGPMYHSYATRYLTFAAAALETATDGQMSLTHERSVKGQAGPLLDWTHAGDFRLAMTGPTGKSANFGDGAEILGNTAWMLWLARLDHRPDYVAFQVDADRTEPSAFDLLWYAPPTPPPAEPRPRFARMNERPGETGNGPAKVATAFDSAVVLRGPADDPNAAFLTVRIGRTDTNHAHLDLGTFVYDVLGERFACDLGPDSYDLPGYMHQRRPDYLRTSTPGHNTLTLGETSQPTDAEARLLPGPSKSAKGDDEQSARIDLTDAYPGAKSIIRSATLDGDTATITDAIKLKRSANIVWHLHTPAKVRITKDGAILDNNGRRVELRVLEPDNAKLSAEPDTTEPPQEPIEGITHIRLRVHVNDEATIKVQLRRSE